MRNRRRHDRQNETAIRRPCLLRASAWASRLEHCIYVGDDRRDVQAGRAAGMKTIVVKFGYLHGNDPEAWDADAMIDTPGELLQHL